MSRRSFLVLAAGLAVTLGAPAPDAWAETAVNTCRTIDQPGKYRLIKNLQVTGAAATCLRILTSDVVVDLDGHAIFGNGGSGTAGIDGGLFDSNIVVRNGMVKSFGRGIDLSEGKNVRVERMHVHNNLGIGIFVGHNATVTSNVVTDNSVGILARPQSTSFEGEGGIISDNIVSENRSDGMRIETPGALITRNVVRRNQGDGISVECPANLIANSITSNRGVELNFVGTVGCIVSQNLAP
jgi:Periplasmic copper-binding protein (NosD)